VLFRSKNLLLLNTEVRIPIAESLTGVGFVDVGDAWGSSLRGDPHRYANYLKWATNGGDLNGDGVRDPSPGTYSVYDAYEYRFPQSNSLELHPSFGVGIRVKTPLGPLRLDYGISPWGSVTHFSIAQAF
jgi:outer membrane protein insertion porin family